MQKTITKFLTNITATILLLTVFACTIPTHKAEAGGALTGVEIAKNTAVSALANTTNAANTTSLLLKETTLDGIGWAIAKQMVSNMTRSMINWVNSGFEGSPAFISDFKGFLLDAVDSAAGEYIKSLGGIGEFICSPFKLDIQAALTISYAEARSGMPSGPNACKLSDIGENIEDFFAGTNSGGWGDWLKVTSNPQNTPMGAYLEAEAKLNIALRNEAGQEIKIADWGQGFLSKKVCEPVAGGGQKCKVTTPGQVISEALTFQLSTGPRSLIEADEINELIGALLNQLTLKAMEGINGLLGMSAGTGYTDYSSSTSAYIDEAVSEQNQLFGELLGLKQRLDESIKTEGEYLSLVSSSLTTAQTKLNTVTDGQRAINSLFSTTTAATFNLSKSQNIKQIRAKISSGEANAVSARADLDVLEKSVETILNINGADTGTKPDEISITEIEAEGAKIASNLSLLVTEISTIVPTVTDNMNKLRAIEKKYNEATGDKKAETQTAALTEYMLLISQGKLTPPAIISLKKTDWNNRLYGGLVRSTDV